jgi:hypothetical protein
MGRGAPSPSDSRQESQGSLTQIQKYQHAHTNHHNQRVVGVAAAHLWEVGESKDKNAPELLPTGEPARPAAIAKTFVRKNFFQSP